MNTLEGKLAFWLLASFIFVLDAPATVFFVDVNSASPTPPYTNWSIAATDIQSAINAAGYGDLILVTNGIYQTGSSLTTDPGNVYSGNIYSRIKIPGGVTVSSVNGPGVTIIKGGSPNPNACACLLGNAMLSGFTLTNGYALNFGGGAYCLTTSAVISNCVICSNLAFQGGGGGVYLGTLNNCIISNNIAGYDGGGVHGSVVNDSIIINNRILSGSNAKGGGASGALFPGDPSGILNGCAIIGNSSAYDGGGAFGCVINNSLIASNYASHFGGSGVSNRLNNCVIIYNYATFHSGAWLSALTNCTLWANKGTNFDYEPIYACTIRNSILSGYGSSQLNLGNSFSFCCADSLQAGTGNIAAQPLFVNTNLNDFHLQSNSPCINAGNNAFVTGTNDYDGNLRIVGGTVDIGAYEYQTPSSVLSYAWAQQYGLPTNGTADYADSDSDGLNNWQEWIAGTIPTNSASVLALQAPATTNVTGITLTWQSVNTRTYYLQSSTNLPVFTSIQSNLVGLAGSTSFTDSTATNGGPYFYRVGVQ